MKYAEQHGLLTEECFPYISGKDGKVPPCPKSNCSGKGTFRKYHCKGESTKTIPEMKMEIMTYGPVALDSTIMKTLIAIITTRQEATFADIT
jgi:hypothetical protein